MKENKQQGNLMDFLLDNEPRYLLSAEASNGESLELTEGTLSECKDYEKYDRENGQTADILQIFKYYYKKYNTKMSKTTILISIYIAVLIIYSITVMI